MVDRDRDFDDFAVGDWVSFTRRFDKADMDAFAELSGDHNPLHTDPTYAGASSFGAPIAPVHLIAAPFSAIAGMMIPGHRALYLGSHMRALHPARFGRDIAYSARVAARNAAQRVLTLRVIAWDGETVLLEGEIRVQVRDDVPTAAAPEATVAVNRGDDDRLALVTGASGAIGRAVARRLAQKGWNLLLHHHRNEAAARTLAKACMASGVTAKTVEADLCDSKAVGRLARKAKTATALVHAASPPIDAPADARLAANDGALDRLARAALPAMLARQDGAVVLVGSAAMHTLPSGWGNYVAAKAAAVSRIESLRRHYGPYGVRALTLAPSYVATPFSEAHRPREAPALLPEEVAEAIVEAVGSGDEGYVLLEPTGRRSGTFGFRSIDPRPGPQEVETHGNSGASAPSPGAAGLQARDDGALQDLVRTVLDIPASEDLEDAGLDLTANWDSLRHIELMLLVEERFGLSLSSRDFERTTRYVNLRDLVAAQGPTS